MNKQEIVEVPINDLKVLENSRFRIDNVADLMENIKQNGLIQPIVVRRSDRAVICGNRRLSACKKLNWRTIPSIIRDVSDKELFLQNLSENMKRKSIKSIEIGRMVDGFKSGKLTGQKMSYKEIAIALGEKASRMKTVHEAFRTIPKEFHKDIALFTKNKDRSYGDIPESVIRQICWLHRRKRLADSELKMLLQASRDKKLQMTDIDTIHTLFVTGMTMEQAIEEIDNWVVSSPKIVLNKKELAKEMRKDKVTMSNLIRKALSKLNPKLVF